MFHSTQSLGTSWAEAGNLFMSPIGEDPSKAYGRHKYSHIQWLPKLQLGDTTGIQAARVQTSRSKLYSTTCARKCPGYFRLLKTVLLSAGCVSHGGSPAEVLHVGYNKKC